VNSQGFRVNRWIGLGAALFSFTTTFAFPAGSNPTVQADSALQAGIRLYSEGKYRDAVRTFGQIAFDSLSAPAAFYVGASYAAESDIQNSIRYLKRAVALLPSHIGYRFQLARVLAQSGSTRESMAQYESIIIQDSTYIPALVNLGLLLGEQRERQRSVAMFFRAVQQNPRNFLNTYYLGSSLIDGGEADSGRSFLAVCLSLNPRYVPALTLLASLYFGRTGYEEALRLYSLARAQDSGNADLSYMVGLCHEKLHDYFNAVDAFRQAAMLDSSNSNYFAHLGQSCFQVKDFAGSIEAFEKAAYLDEGNPVLYLNIGLAWVQMDSVQNAVRALSRAITAYHPDKIAYVYEQMGAIHYNKKQYRSARAAYRDALRVDPSNAPAQFYLAVTYEQLKDYRSALEGFKKYLKLVTDDSTHREKTGFARKAVERLRRVGHR
jgi:tetratricopeptide (TPR) repeat protein